MNNVDRDMRVELWLQNPIFAAAGADVCQELARRCPRRIYPPRSRVVSCNTSVDSLYVLLCGSAWGVARVPEQREFVTRLLRAPAVFGESALLHQLPLQENLTCIDTLELAEVPRELLRGILRDRPRARDAVLHHTAATAYMMTRNHTLIAAPAAQRIATLLLSYAEVCGRTDARGTVIDCRLSQADLAAQLCLVRRSVASAVGDWKKAGIVEQEDERFILLDPGRILELSGASRAGSLCYQLGRSLAYLGQAGLRAEAEVELFNGEAKRSASQVKVHAELMVGSEASCRLRLVDPTVSRRHLRIFRTATGGRYWIEDLKTNTGTWVNGRCVQRAVLRDGDWIEAGSTRLRFRLARRDLPEAV